MDNNHELVKLISSGKSEDALNEVEKLLEKSDGVFKADFVKMKDQWKNYEIGLFLKTFTSQMVIDFKTKELIEFLKKAKIDTSASKEKTTVTKKITENPTQSNSRYSANSKTDKNFSPKSTDPSITHTEAIQSFELNGITWIVLFVLLELIVLFLPIYVYDRYFWSITIISMLLNVLLIAAIKKNVLRTSKTTGLTLIILVLFFLNYQYYKYRKESIFTNEVVLTSPGKVVEQYSQGGGRTSKRYYLEYEFSANTQKYRHVHEVPFWVWFNYNSNKELTIEYVAEDPRVSRIHNSSLIEHPERENLLNRIKQESQKNQ